MRTSAHCSRLAASESRSRIRAGSSPSTVRTYPATCIAVTKVSLLDWLALTSLFGCSGALDPRSPPSSSLPRLAMTSFTLALVWVPEPVWNTTSGNSSSSSPAMICRATAMIVSAFSRDSTPKSRFAIAAASLTWAMARITSSGIRSPIRKFCRLRCVCAPQ